ncbi:MAG: hypothetical protein AABZ65_00485 [Candidatus Omnitrophota bacterium]
MKISIYPLHELDSDVTLPVEIANGVTVISNNIDIRKIKKINVSKEDAHHLVDPKLCLQVNEKIVSPEKASIVFIISCRLLKRTKVFIRYRVDSSSEVRKIRDDYPFVTSRNVTTEIKGQEFKKIAKLYLGLNEFKDINKRTGNAAYFLGMAYRSRGWLESLIFHVCALETLTLASNRESSITQKFKERIHNFIGYDKDKLEKIYNIRSELVHGRYSYSSAKQNLRLFRIAEDVSRRMFKKILLNPKHLKAFINDSSRMKLFL